MAFAGFGKNSGPSVPPKGPIPFGSFPNPSPNSNPNPNPNPNTNLEKLPPVAATRSMVWQRLQASPPKPERPAVSPNWGNEPKQPLNLPSITNHPRLSPVATKTSPFVAKRTRSPPLSSHEDDILGLYNVANHGARRPTISPNLGNQPKLPVNLPSVTNHQGSSPVIANGTTHGTGATYPTKPTIFQAASRSRPPPSSNEDDILGLYTPNRNANRLESHLDMRLENRTNESLKWTRSPPLSFEGNQSVQNPEFSHEVTERYNVSPPKVGSRKNSPVNAFADSTANQRFNSVNSNDPSAHQRSRIIESSFAVRDAATISPLSNAHINAPKRGRTPPQLATGASLTASPIHLDDEREMQLKAKRLARFNTELSQPLETLRDRARDKFSGNKQDPTVFTQRNNADKLVEEARNVATANTMSDNEGSISSTVVVGLCPDMCPELEREERERKGDLDKFERIDGDRNQTSKFLAVKKYNRTAEREPNLIRPLPVLQMTLDYLLNLLDQPYDETFLGIYNFLWDRMRAVRMDLRMQHIFNRESILMLEQMIRLHIAAMHELCEYKKGEGFSEGFDAHLNIEQMNKTSVELFHMYDDHRKKGICVPTEKEFRGYYALLKLDKHPGYKVEPSELSLDLAKMTSEMRCTPEILFARDVARACRFGNYIAFFRLARKASYLQASLMHAHFAKLRTQALASLHSGLQNNQGIPISNVILWLGMEGEDIDSLLEYHGFSLRRYDEMYMVKEGPFLNSDTDFPTKCSQLVHLKKSRRIANDVKFQPAFLEVTKERETVPDVTNIIDQRFSPSKTVRANVDDEEMLEYKANSSPSIVDKSWQFHEGPPLAIWNRETDQKIGGSFIIPNIDKDLEIKATDAREFDREMEEVSLGGASGQTEESNSALEQEIYSENEPTVEFTGPIRLTFMDTSALPKPEVCAAQAGVTASTNSDSIVLNYFSQKDVDKFLENERSMLASQQKDEALRERLKIIIRKWKKRSSILREAQEQKEFLANAALSSLSLGPPIRRQPKQLTSVGGEVNIDFVARERYVRQRTSWGPLNVSEMVAPNLSTRDLVAKIICWKAVILLQENDTESQIYNLASRWLVSKLMGTGIKNDDELVVSLPGISIWKKWTGPQFKPSQTCCLSVIREIKLDNHEGFDDDILAGSSSLLFLVSKSIPWEIQKFRLHKFLASLPAGYNLPLLIVNSEFCNREHTVSRLGLDEADKTRIRSLSVIFLTGSIHIPHANSFFDDNQLREGLQWLANESPLQPTLNLVKTRELVLTFMKHSIDTLENLNVMEVNPDHCISAFNKALNCTAEAIVAAASANSNNWPSPEFNLLDESSDKKLIADLSLPIVGWSSVERIKQIVSAIKGCSLPKFPSDMSWLSKGCTIGAEILSQKLAIEECLISYMTQSIRLLNADLAATEASVMLQQCAGLELRGSCLHVVPRWVKIFRRIYNWQLTRLTAKEISEAYILGWMDLPSKSGDSVTKDLHTKFLSKDCQPQTRLSLDELIEMGCSVPFAEQQPVSDMEPTSKSPERMHKVVSTAETNINCWNNNDDDLEHGNSTSDADMSEQSRGSPPGNSSNDRLAMLLEQCNLLQDKIDSKLAIFF